MMGGGYGGGMMGGGYGGMMGMGGYQGGYGPGLIPGMTSGMGYPQYPGGVAPVAAAPVTAAGTGSRGATGDQTGTYMSGNQNGGPPANMPRIIPNPMDNTLLIQATPQEYQQILKLLKDMDIAPRQVLTTPDLRSLVNGAFTAA
jgi:hypothetical protein